MNKMNIVELMSIGSDDFTTQLGKIIENNDEYQKAQEIFSKHLESLKSKDFDYMNEVENCECIIEAVTRVIAFNEGFKLGVRLIIGCCDSGRGEFGV